MILQQYRNNGYCNISIALIIKKVFANSKADIIYNLMATGYIQVFKFFEENAFFKNINLIKNTKLQTTILQRLKNEFRDSIIEDNGVIRNAWNNQTKNTLNAWPKDIAKKYNFPEDVNYFSGDVLVKTYQIIADNYINKFVSQVGN